MDNNKKILLSAGESTDSQINGAGVNSETVPAVQSFKSPVNTHARNYSEELKELKRTVAYCKVQLIERYLKKEIEEGDVNVKVKGYAYGIVLENKEVLFGTSESLSKWWKEVVKFDQAAQSAGNGNQNSASGN